MPTSISHALIAHRGWRNRYPENTAIAIEQAIHAGAKQVEVDIQLSQDRVPYLCHDHHLKRLCDNPADICQLTAAQLATLSAYEPLRLGQQFINTPLCSLSQCVQLIADHPQVTLYAEIKEHSIQTLGIDVCLAAILPELYHIQQRCVIISFDVDILVHAQQKGWQRVGPVLHSWEQAFDPQIHALAPDIIFCDKDLLATNKTVADLPFPSAFYEIDSYSEAVLLLQQGAHLIETFRIGEMIEEDTQ